MSNLFITKIQDTIFEGLSEDESMKWTERLFEAIPVGADLTTVMPKFLLSLMKRNIQNVDKDEDTEAYSAMEEVIKVLSDWVDTGSVDQGAAANATKAAYYAAANTADYADYAAKAAYYAAYYVAKAAYAANDTYAAEAAAYYADNTAYAADAAEAAARAAANIEYKWMAAELISLIKASN